MPNTYQCPNCKAGLESLVFVEYMVHHYQIVPHTGLFTDHTLEPARTAARTPRPAGPI